MLKKLRSIVKNRTVLVLLIIILFLLLAMFFTRPVLTRGGSATVAPYYDPLIQAWTLSWDIHELARAPLNLFNANIFFPNHYTLAYSDHQVVNALLAVPLMAINHNPIRSQNCLLIFQFFLCSLGAYLLTAHLTKSRLAGVVAGIAYAYAPYKLGHLVHLNLSTAGYIPLCFLFLHRYCEERKARDAVLCALFFTLQTLSTWHYGLILSVGLFVFLVVRLIWKRDTFRLKWMVVLFVAFACAMLAVLPFAIPYFKLRGENPQFQFTAKDVEYYSADVQDFLVAPTQNLLWGKITGGLEKNTWSRGYGERAIFPGLIPLVLGIFGAVYLFRKGRGEDRFAVWFYASMTVVSALLCLGTTVFIFGHRFSMPMPYDVLFRFFPGFKAMRVPPRFSILIALSLAVLSGYAVKQLVSWLRSKRGAVVSTAAAVVVLGLLAADLMSISVPMSRVPPRNEFPPVYSWLKKQGGEAPTAELPLQFVYSPTWFKQESMRSYYSTLHWKKIFNGYSSFMPASYYDGIKACEDFPSEKCVEFFRDLGIKYLIVHEGELDRATIDRLRAWEQPDRGVRVLKKFGSDTVYLIEKGP